MPSSVTVTRREGRRSKTTVLTTTSVETIRDDLPDLSQRWNGDLTPDNIRLTAFGSKRTSYTYAESGGYRSDCLRDKWSAPNLSRAALGPSVGGLAFQRESEVGFSNRNQRLEMLTRNRSGKDTKSNHTLTKRYTSSPIDQGDISSGRSMCTRFVGEWCLHSDCAVLLERSSGGNPSIGQHDSSTASSLATSKPFESLPLSFESGDLGARTTRRRSSRLSRTPLTRTRRDSSSSAATQDTLVQGPSTGGANISTYVYTSGLTAVPPGPANGDGPESSHWQPTRAPQPRSAETAFQAKATGDVVSRLPAASTEHRQGSWLTKSIFGLERTSALHQPGPSRRRSTGPFISSDTEDNVSGDRRRTRSSTAQWRAESHPAGHPQSLITRLYHSTLGPVFSYLRETGVRLCDRFSHLSIQLLAFLLVFVYTCVGMLFQAGYWLFSKAHLWTKALTSRRQAPSSRRPFYTDYRKTGLHPRLSEFHHRPNLTGLAAETGEERINTNNSLCDARCLSQYRWWTNRIAGLLCLLLLLLLLLFLLAPIASDTEQQGTWWAFFLPDEKCLQTGIARPDAEDARIWVNVRWRTRCLHQTYLVQSPTSDSGASGAFQEWSHFFSDFFGRIRRWFGSTKNEHVPSFNLHLAQNNHSQLLKEVASFVSAVNQRLDVLSKTIVSTDSQLSSLADRVDRTGDSLRAQVAGLETSLSHQTHHWDKWHRDIQLTIAQLTAGSPSGGGGDREEGLVQAVLAATNATITQQMASVHRQLLAEQGHLSREANATLLELSLLVTTLRQQMSSRMKQAEKEIEQLRVHLDNSRTHQTDNETAITATLGELHRTIQVLSARLNLLEKASSDAERLILHLRQNIDRCQHDQATTTEQCQKITVQYVNSAITSLSHKLSNDVSSMVNETLANEIPVHLANSNFWVDLQAKVKQMTLEAVDQAVVKLKLQHSPVQLTGGAVDVQMMIETALNRFAADRTGMADFALESAGGAVVGTRCTRTYTDGAALFSLFGIPLARLTNSARTILQPGNNPGDCWPFHGSTGHAIIRLATSVFISAVSLEHLPRDLAPNGRLDSAPKDFVIKGLTSENDEDGIELGNFTYDINGSPIQTFFLSKPVDQPHQYIELHVLSNHGHPLYTCVYRLRVHGKMVP